MPQAEHKVIVVGGDGFCGWPISLHLSNIGMDVMIVDNFKRREIDRELGADSLTPIWPIEDRLVAWREATGKEILFRFLDVVEDYEGLLALINEFQPTCIIDLAKIKSAPYSMKSQKHKKATIYSNLISCDNILTAILESGLDIHLVHLGTMGVYGYRLPTGEPIPEGYLDVKLQTKKGGKLIDWTIPYPPSPGSIYHLTKTQEALAFQFYNRTYSMRITDLHQGVVWGSETDLTALDPRLMNRFDYDADYGTILNRFMLQAVINYPLTVYGTGGQTRAFIHIKDTCKCIELAILNSPKKGEKVHIYNQMTECRRIRDLAKMISDLTGCPVQNLNNPRAEDLENELVVENETFIKYGLKPTLLSDSIAKEVMSIATKYKDNAIPSVIRPQVKWRKEDPDP
jgi:UDP-sulfoquinovose synthase